MCAKCDPAIGAAIDQIVRQRVFPGAIKWQVLLRARASARVRGLAATQSRNCTISNFASVAITPPLCCGAILKEISHAVQYMDVIILIFQ
jgi:hypothetical protein